AAQVLRPALLHALAVPHVGEGVRSLQRTQRGDGDSRREYGLVEPHLDRSARLLLGLLLREDRGRRGPALLALRRMEVRLADALATRNHRGPKRTRREFRRPRALRLLRVLRVQLVE